MWGGVPGRASAFNRQGRVQKKAHGSPGYWNSGRRGSQLWVPTASVTAPPTQTEEHQGQGTDSCFFSLQYPHGGKWLSWRLLSPSPDVAVPLGCLAGALA